MTKPRILLVLFNDTAAKGIFDTTSIQSLAASADLGLVHAMPIDADPHYFKRVYHWPRMPKRELPWLALYQLHLMPFTRAHYPERLGDQNLWQGLPPFARRLLKLLDNRTGRALAVPFLKWILTRTNPLPHLIEDSYDVIVCITGLKDPLYEDVVRLGRARNVPVVAITQNWDNVNYKPIVERPDMLGVWGMQGYYVARLLHGLPHQKLAPVGAARMDVYFKELPERSFARRQMGLPEGRRILLFAGAGPQFEETSIIEQLHNAAADGRLPSDLLVLYKPHPKRAPRPHERPLDLTKLPNVRVIPPEGAGSVSLGRMPVLLRAVDAVASPYSTLLLESALCGRPCLAIAYDDPAHPEIKWETVRTYIHLIPLAFAQWALACADKERIVADVSKLLTLAGRGDLERRAREDALHVLYNDSRDFGARVAAVAMRFVKDVDGEPAANADPSKSVVHDGYEIAGTR